MFLASYFIRYQISPESKKYILICLLEMINQVANLQYLQKKKKLSTWDD